MRSRLDKIIEQVDLGLKTLLLPHQAKRQLDVDESSDALLTEQERKHSIGLMRVNHCGEIAAQALYRAQAVVARNPHTVDVMQSCAEEEVDHLSWCEMRIDALGGRLSYLSPVWYWGSFAIGMLAGTAGDAYNLGFIDETEQQVAAHLDRHLERIAENDRASIEVIEQMREDEARHAATAREQGGSALPWPIPKVMRMVSKVMTQTAYYV